MGCIEDLHQHIYGKPFYNEVEYTVIGEAERQTSDRGGTITPKTALQFINFQWSAKTTDR